MRRLTRFKALARLVLKHRRPALAVLTLTVLGAFFQNCARMSSAINASSLAAGRPASTAVGSATPGANVPDQSTGNPISNPSAGTTTPPSTNVPPSTTTPPITNAPPGGASSTPSGASNCLKVYPADVARLQALTDANACVELQAGLFVIGAQITMSTNHTLRGVGADQTILRANAATWVFAAAEALVASVNATGVNVNNLTLDGAGVATYAVAARGMDVENTTMINTRGSGVGIAGTGMIIRNNVIRRAGQTTAVNGRGNINCATMGGVAEGAEIYAEGSSDSYAPVITGNVISDGIGPALDINGVWGGTFSNNVAAITRPRCSCAKRPIKTIRSRTTTYSQQQAQRFHRNPLGGSRRPRVHRPALQHADRQRRTWLEHWLRR